MSRLLPWFILASAAPALSYGRYEDNPHEHRVTEACSRCHAKLGHALGEDPLDGAGLRTSVASQPCAATAPDADVTQGRF